MLDQIQTIIDLSGYEATEDEHILAKIFVECEGHHSLSELRQLFCEAAGRAVSIKDIRRFMSFLCEYGVAEKKSFPEGARYEHRHIGEHHDHLICSKCGNVVEFEKTELEELQKQIAGSYGFTLYRHVMDLYGICGDCRERTGKALSFDEVPESGTIVVSHIGGSDHTVRHLADLGIIEGTRVTLIRQKPMLLVSVGDTRFALGNDLADKISGIPVQE